jgi:hypothetical protein
MLGIDLKIVNINYDNHETKNYATNERFLLSRNEVSGFNVYYIL